MNGIIIVVDALRGSCGLCIRRAVGTGLYCSPDGNRLCTSRTTVLLAGPALIAMLAILAGSPIGHTTEARRACRWLRWWCWWARCFHRVSGHRPPSVSRGCSSTGPNHGGSRRRHRIGLLRLVLLHRPPDHCMVAHHPIVGWWPCDRVQGLGVFESCIRFFQKSARGVWYPQRADGEAVSADRGPGVCSAGCHGGVDGCPVASQDGRVPRADRRRNEGFEDLFPKSSPWPARPWIGPSAFATSSIQCTHSIPIDCRTMRKLFDAVQAEIDATEDRQPKDDLLGCLEPVPAWKLIDIPPAGSMPRCANSNRCPARRSVPPLRYPDHRSHRAVRGAIAR